MRMEGKLGKLVEIVDPQASGEHAEHVDPPKVTQQAMPSDFDFGRNPSSAAKRFPPFPASHEERV